MRSLANQHDRAALLLRLQTLTPDSQRRWGTMSAHQMICHLSDAFGMVTGDRPVTLPRGRIRSALIRWFALYAPLRWPKGIPTTANLDQGRGGTTPSEFATDMAKLTGLLERVCEWRDCGGVGHPLFGTMSQAAWLRWSYLHVDHHLRQFGL